MKEIIQKELLYPEIIWERPVHYYKNEGGKILIIAGSKSNPQKAILACESVFRSGTGVLTLGFPKNLSEIYKDFLPDTMKLPLPETFGGSLSQKGKDEIIEHSKVCDLAFIGPGLSNNAETVHLTWDLLSTLQIPVVLADDSIEALIKGILVMRSKEDEDYLTSYFEKLRSTTIVINESNLTDLIAACQFKEFPKTNNETVKRNKKEILSILSRKLNLTIILLGGGGGMIVTRDELIENKIGEMNSPILAGMVSSFIAQNIEKKTEAISTALYLHGLTEKIAKEKIGEREILNSDILRYLQKAIQAAENH